MNNSYNEDPTDEIERTIPDSDIESDATLLDINFLEIDLHVDASEDPGTGTEINPDKSYDNNEVGNQGSVEVHSLLTRILYFPDKFAKRIEKSLITSIDRYIEERDRALERPDFEGDLTKEAEKHEAEKIVLLDLKDRLSNGQIQQKKGDFFAGLGALGLGYLTYGALLSGNAVFLAPILAYEAIPFLGGSPALYSAIYMTITFGIPETIKILREGSEIGVRRGLTGTWLRVAGALNEIGFLIMPLLKDRSITIKSTRLLSSAVLSRMKIVSRGKNLFRGLTGREVQPVYKEIA
jgi:hypothetical protein